MLTREQMISFTANLKRKVIDIPEWGESVLIRELTGAERDKLESYMLKANKTNDFKGMRARMVCMTCINEAGEHLFSEKDLELVSALSGDVLEKIFKEASILSGMTPQAEEGNLQNDLIDMPGSE